MRINHIGRYMLIAYLILLSINLSVSYAQARFSVDINQQELSALIKLLAKQLHMHVILSPRITGKTALHWHRVPPKRAFKVLLASHGLTTVNEQGLIYIAPYTELIEQQQVKQKWRQVQLATTPMHIFSWPLHYAKARDVARIIHSKAAVFLSARGQVQVDERSNLLLIKDINAKQARIGKLIRQLDVPIPQVLIAVRLVSVDKDWVKSLGIQFATPLVQGKARFFIFKWVDNSALDIKLSALEQAGHAELISSPQLFTSNQQAASIEAGEEIPYQEVSESGGTTTTFKKAVLGLQVTPQLLPDERVLLNLKINQDRPAAKMVQGVPAISTRQIKTTVMISSGQTLVLGGIYEFNQEHTAQGIPYISQLPVVGWIFKQRNFQVVKRELLIFVTPTIIA